MKIYAAARSNKPDVHIWRNAITYYSIKKLKNRMRKL